MKETESTQIPKKSKAAVGIVLAVVFVVVLSVGAGAFVTFGDFSSQSEPQVLSSTDSKTNEPIEARAEEPGSVEKPVRIKIPSIGVDAVIEAVGVTKDGAMDVPKEKDNTGWYMKGAAPGEIGSAVIDGHLDWYNNQRAVFFNLHKVEVGQEVVVIDEKGIERTFVVQEKREVDANADSKEIFTKKDGKYLNLITCQGAWDRKSDSYTKRLIIFTKLKEAEEDE